MIDSILVLATALHHPGATATMIRTLLFDLGNVLVNFSHERMCRQIADLVGASTQAVHTAIFDSGLLAPFERGRIDAAEFQRRLESELGVRFVTDDLHRAASDIFEPNLTMRPLLDELRNRGYRLVMLSNTCILHYDWLRSRSDVFSPFHSLILSFQAGAAKPEDAVYEQVLSEIHCDPAECLYTDDIALYVEAGRRHGLVAEVFTDPAAFRTQLRRHGVI